jgi:hypothetical protein
LRKNLENRWSHRGEEAGNAERRRKKDAEDYYGKKKFLRKATWS